MKNTVRDALRDHPNQKEIKRVLSEALDEPILESESLPKMPDDSDIPLEYLLVDDPAIEVTVKQSLQKIINEQLHTLSERERIVLQMRFGLGGVDEYTLQEVGDVFDVTKSTIQQAERKALRKLRHPSRSSILRSHFYNEEYEHYAWQKEKVELDKQQQKEIQEKANLYRELKNELDALALQLVKFESVGCSMHAAITDKQMRKLIGETEKKTERRVYINEIVGYAREELATMSQAAIRKELSDEIANEKRIFGKGFATKGFAAIYERYLAKAVIEFTGEDLPHTVAEVEKEIKALESKFKQPYHEEYQRKVAGSTRQRVEQEADRLKFSLSQNPLVDPPSVIESMKKLCFRFEREKIREIKEQERLERRAKQDAKEHKVVSMPNYDNAMDILNRIKKRHQKSEDTLEM